MIGKLSGIIGICLLACAVQAAVFNAASEKRFEKMVVRAKQSHQLYPHLSEKQVAQIPVLLAQAATRARANEALTWVTQEDVVENLHFYLGGYNPLEQYADTEEKLIAAQDFSAEDLAHALHYALVIIVPEKYRTFLKPQLYPPVKDWEKFYILCQAYMDEFYKVLSQELAVGNASVIEEVFLIDPD